MRGHQASWHHGAVHYAVVPTLRREAGWAPWALQRFCGADVRTVCYGTFEECCAYLERVRTYESEEVEA